MTRQQSEKSLVRKAIRRDPEAFTELYHRNVGRVYKHVFFKVRNQNAAEDITQDTFIRAWKAIDRYQERGNTFAAWLTAIADNRTVDFFKANPGVVPLDESALTGSGKGQRNILATTDTQSDISEALSKLPEEKQKVVRMRYIEGFSFQEIARVLKKTEGAVRVIMHRSLRELRDILGL